ncbi:beta-lactamase class C AmpC-like protein [Psychroflexus torquis ATCC 700755]|uniref:Beta-lactamase class C AmpC-like protein n=1 Tax=Psychroflexus torquis (strain ATCC 700755 / CIP 106069 / ACAM 623) TaxID=313595 RepID=K4IVB4_PSYTT|nr:serine hydrolase [Psychroflexus torquis]AFU69415.1 beta-lactamase class C AmpC-like protein [Psychroflexus torquis ATCC 700755]
MKRIIKCLFALILTAALWSILVFFGTVNGWLHKPFTKSTDPELFTVATKTQIEKEFVRNFAMAIMKEGRVEKQLFHSANKKVDKNTIFQVASFSKFVSTVEIMKLVEMGKINLDTPVSDYLKRWQLPPSEFDHEQVTVRRLLSHTSGLTDGLGYSGFTNCDSIQTTEASLTKVKDTDAGLSGEVKVGIEPNSAWIYSGGGFTLLQLLVEETSGQTFNEFMKINIFQPLNMTSSTYILNDSLEDRLCEFYNSNTTAAPHFYYTSLAATSLYTSLSDLELFFQFFLKGKNGEPIGRGQISPESLKLMRKPHWDMMGASIYGLGTMLYIDIENDDNIFGHDGQSTPPINTAIRINPKTGDGLIILETGHPDLATRIASDWVFIETGKSDTLLFTMLTGKMTNILFIGLISIRILTIGTGIWRRKRKVLPLNN